MIRATVAEQVYQELRQEILQGVRRPGERVNELTVARQAGISQGPVREALAALRAEGLLESSPSKGSFVTPTFIEDAPVAYEARLRLEPLAAARMCEIASDGDLAMLNERLDAIKRQGPDTSTATTVNHDLRFHEAIFLYTGSVVLLRMWRVLELAMRRYFSLHFEPPVTAEQEKLDLGALHQTLYDAIASGDPEAANRAAAEHIQGSWHLTALGFGLDDERRRSIGD